MKKQQGFTLIELMIVVAIIAILAAIALPAYQDYTIRSQVSEGATLMAGAKAGVTEFWSDKGRFPDNNASAGVPAGGSITGTYVTQVEVGDAGVIEATYGNNVNQKISGGTCSITPRDGGGSVVWAGDCSFPEKWRPSAFRNWYQSADARRSPGPPGLLFFSGAGLCTDDAAAGRGAKQALGHH